MDELITGPYEDMESIKKKLLKTCTGDHFNPLAKASRISRCTTGGHKQWQNYNIIRKNLDIYSTAKWSRTNHV